MTNNLTRENIANYINNEFGLTKYDCSNIVNDIIEGFESNKYEIIYNREKAIKETIKKNKNSIIIVLGKGIENYQLIENKKNEHSDIEIIKEYIDENYNKK